ncbi:deoxyribonuclease IV [[Eubacterium] cellulosolvens]
MPTNVPVKCGVHVSIAGSIDQAVDRAKEKHCDTFQVFTRSPRGWKFKKLIPNEVVRFREKLKASMIEPAVAHMPYLPNLSCPMKVIYKKSVRALTVELDRCSALGIPYLVTHLGSHLGKGRKIGLDRLVEAIDAAFNSSTGRTILLLENTAGTKNSMGSSFEDIREILDHVTEKSRVAVCFDTCHAFAAGYDLRDAESVERTVAELGRVVGLELLKIVHVNDSKGKLASRLDRHEHVGMGQIGEQGFRAILHNDTFRKSPLILETPVDRRGTDVSNLRRIRELAS